MIFFRREESASKTQGMFLCKLPQSRTVEKPNGEVLKNCGAKGLMRCIVISVRIWVICFTASKIAHMLVTSDEFIRHALRPRRAGAGKKSNPETETLLRRTEWNGNERKQWNAPDTRRANFDNMLYCFPDEIYGRY